VQQCRTPSTRWRCGGHASTAAAVVGVCATVVILVCLFLLVSRGSWSQLDVVAALGALSGGAASGVFDRINPALSPQFLRVQLLLGFLIITHLSVIASFSCGAY